MVAEMGNPHEPGRLSVTMKADGRDGMWIVFHGSEPQIRGQVTSVFGIDDDTDRPTWDVLNEGEAIFKGTSAVSSGLGGRTLPKRSESAPTPGSAWDKAAAGEKPEPEVDPNVARISAAIEAATTPDALRDLYARNAAHFTAHPELLPLWQAKGKALS